MICEQHQKHQLQSSHNDTNYWPVNGQLSLECSACNSPVEERAQDQSLSPWMCRKTWDGPKGRFIHIAVSFLIHSGAQRLILGDSYAHPSHSFSHLHTPPPELLSVHLHSQLVDKPRITMWSCLLKAHGHLLALSGFYSSSSPIKRIPLTFISNKKTDPYPCSFNGLSF